VLIEHGSNGRSVESLTAIVVVIDPDTESGVQPGAWHGDLAGASTPVIRG
jgi:hypothetical protein